MVRGSTPPSSASLHVRPLRALPGPSAGVLLDIDADFLAPSPRSTTSGANGPPRPGSPSTRWRLAGVSGGRGCGHDRPIVRRRLQHRCAYRWLPGSSLAARFDGDPVRATAFDQVASGLLAWERGEADAAHVALSAALTGPARAPACFALALIKPARGTRRQARVWCDRAVDADPRTDRRIALVDSLTTLRAATPMEREFARALFIDPDDAYGHLGMGMALHALERRTMRWRR